MYQTKAKIQSKKTVGNHIYASESDRLFYYVGFLPIEERNKNSFYFTGAGHRYRNKENESRYARLETGTLFWDSFLDDQGRFKELEEFRVALPKGSDNFFGVVERGNRTENEGLTREFFGATFEELKELVVAYSGLLHSKPSGYWKPRVTFSGKRSNQCELSGCLIPRNFPYIAFAHSENAWSHISLFGFYNHLNFLRSDSKRNAFHLRMVQQGIEEDLLDDLESKLFNLQGVIRAENSPLL